MEENWIMINDETYDRFMAEIMSMKPNKRKNYKNKLTDKFGGCSKVKYIDGQLMNYSIISHKFVPVVPFRENMCDMKPTSLVGYQIQMIQRHKQYLTQEQTDDLVNKVIQTSVEREHTGNKQKRRVKVNLSSRGKRSSLAF
tara:strand:+ start:51 stop:473 length:423 start_codon:yes stop_codon:yes gene_type:complete